MDVKLFGDAEHDDFPAIQAMLDGEKRIVCLPSPQKEYMIGSTLRIHSGQTLVLPEGAVIRQMDGVNAPMLRNSDGETGAHDIAVIGGIWDMNNLGQSGNQAVKRQDSEDESVYTSGADYADTCNEEGNIRNTFPSCPYYSMNGLVFENVDGLTIANAVFKDPVSFCVMMGRCTHFHVENIKFDFNDGNPLPANMDGIHLEGGCHHGLIHHLRGTVYDDMVALNADELIRGDISHVKIDDLYAVHAHSAVRLLASGHCVHDISISNIRGSYFTYAVGFTKYFKMGNGINGRFENITVRDCEFTKSDILPWFREIDIPLFYFQTETEVNGLILQNIHRTRCGRMSRLFGVENGATVENLAMENVVGDMPKDSENIREFAHRAVVR